MVVVGGGGGGGGVHPPLHIKLKKGCVATKIPLPPPTSESTPEVRLSPVSLKWEVHCPHLLHAGQTTSHTRKRLLSLSSEVIQNEPSVLVLEDLDHVMPHESDAQEQVQENQQAKFFLWMPEGGGGGGCYVNHTPTLCPPLQL